MRTKLMFPNLHPVLRSPIFAFARTAGWLGPSASTPPSPRLLALRSESRGSSSRRPASRPLKSKATQFCRSVWPGVKSDRMCTDS